jgi:hypothetical protein
LAGAWHGTVGVGLGLTNIAISAIEFHPCYEVRRDGTINDLVLEEWTKDSHPLCTEVREGVVVVVVAPVVTVVIVVVIVVVVVEDVTTIIQS